MKEKQRVRGTVRYPVSVRCVGESVSALRYLNPLSKLSWFGLLCGWAGEVICSVRLGAG